MNATILTIKGSRYEVEPIASDTFRLVSGDKVYDVTEGPDRNTCNCPDFAYRHAALPYSVGCKHVVALVDAGLIQSAVPALG